MEKRVLLVRRDLFDTYYNDVIDTIAKRLIEKYAANGFLYTPNPHALYEEYLNQRTMLRDLIKEVPKTKNSSSCSKDEVPLLDAHKVSACFTCAIIKVRLISNSNINDEISAPYLLSETPRLNEQFAVLCGLSVLFSYMSEDKKNLSLTDDTSQIDFVFPETHYNTESKYLDSLVRALYYTNTYTAVNPLLLSNIYFLLESYHRQHISFTREIEKLKAQQTQKNN